jgi:plasmid stabilization system protein ParE
MPGANRQCACQLRLASFARRDGTILDYSEDRSPQGTRSVKEQLEGAIEFLAEHPHSGRSGGKRDLRRLVVNPYPYRIFYRVKQGDIVIHGIRHGARKPRRHGATQ